MANADRSAEQFRKMTETPIPKLILSLAAPTILSMLITSIYNLADTFFVGQISTSASGAVGVVSSLMAIIQALGFMLGHGAGTIISRSLGSRDTTAATRFASTSFFTALVFGVVLAVAGLGTLPHFMMLLGSTETILPHACAYARPILIAAPLMISSLVMNNILRYEGKASFAMIGLVTGGLLNIALDPLFIFALDMGVRGAALATVLSQALSCVWVTSFLCGKKTLLRLRRENLLSGLRLVPPCIALGSSSFVMQASESVIFVCFNSSLLKYGGDLAVGAMTILTSVMQFALLPLTGLSQGAQPITSYNYGARNTDRVRQSFRLLLRACLIYSMALWAFVMLCPRVFAGLFTTDAALLAFTSRALRIYCGGLGLFGIQIACQMTLVSTGNAVCSIIVAVLRKFVLLIPLIYILPRFLPDPTTAVYLAEPVADVLAVTFTAVLFSVQFKKSLQKLETPLQ